MGISIDGCLRYLTYAEFQNRSTYEEAVVFAEQGQFFAAYETFMLLADYKDSSDRAKACVQPMPDSKELFHDESFRSSSNDFVFDGESNTVKWIRIIFNFH